MKKIILLAVATLFATISFAQSEKRINENFKVDKNTKLVVESQFGDVIFKPLKSNEIDVDVKFAADSEKKLQEYFDLWTINISKDEASNTVYVELDLKTSSNKIFKKNNVSINGSNSVVTNISIPEDIDIEIDNTFGNVVMGSHKGDFEMTLSYGAFTAKSLTGEKVNINASFCKPITIQNILKADVELSYSTMNLDSAHYLELESDFSSFNGNLIKELKLNSEYDKINIEEAKNISVDAEFTNMTVELISESVYGKLDYGKLTIDALGDDFNKLDFRCEFNDFRIANMNNIDFKSVDLQGEYTSFDVNNSQWSKNNANIDKHYWYNNPSGKAELKIIAEYGSIEIE